ncbi:hypothetical protein GCM10022225_10340 [Plantactinospora mayteni]|uniref:Uncharacterized protein n=1 Tax=Plantactinospora mayteni TaxID=566021 RepID=A0ABQ4EJ45_9ACTN|nr:hypothetical protein [Plantactinospora mayteni]GIG94217.1 hypothetical protein Pma05_07900 [Plantactinospora mayteni]
MDSIVAQQQTDEQIVAQHLAGQRCAECAPRGGCMRMLRVIRRRQARADLAADLAARTGVTGW